jgi:coenzyme F420-reducing hydrogenase gamma subunit
MPKERSYLGVPLKKPRVGFFDFTACEGCQLQILNNESTLLDFLELVEVVNFREAMTEASDDYDIAFIEGSITRVDEAKRLKGIRAKAGTLVAFGTCACFGGVNQLKNRFGDISWVTAQVYGDTPVQTQEASAISRHVDVDLNIYGCPINKREVEETVLNIVLGKSVSVPQYPVCMECKANENVCMFDLGEPCLGPVTRAGCNSWCPNGRMGCWGCRGPAEDCNIDLLLKTIEDKGITAEALLDRLECFGGFSRRLGPVRQRAMQDSKRRVEP